jgi:protein-L-isoaspartate(D-aspartate) O-methyltransferase
MVERDLHGRGIHHADLLDVFARTPRERFLPPARCDEAYDDRPVPIGLGQTISQPYIVALMVQELDPRGDHRILDVGAGSGYQTAILAALCAHVYAAERLNELAERAMTTLAGLNVDNVTIGTMDGSLGWPEEAPFDRIICGAASPDVPQAWIDQLADGGRIVVPVGEQYVQTLIALDKKGEKVTRRKICGVRFVKLIGRQGWGAGESPPVS